MQTMQVLQRSGFWWIGEKVKQIAYSVLKWPNVKVQHCGLTIMLFFSDEDFENINKLAGETKVEDISKIGRFGLGFNAVYHLTDVPSFISREHLVVFDPNIHHLQRHIKDRSRPGIHINLAEKPNSLTRYHDQFQLYNVNCAILHKHFVAFTTKEHYFDFLSARLPKQEQAISAKRPMVMTGFKQLFLTFVNVLRPC